MTSSVAPPPVVAGTDGSPASERAVAWAVGEAFRRGTSLRIIHAFALPRYGVHLTPEGEEGGPLREAAQHIVDAARRQAAELAPDLGVSVQLHLGTPAAALRQESTAAALVVVGARGRGGFPGLRAGSAAVQAATHASCPVVVVPETAAGVPATDTVVVGVDGSPTSNETLEFAFGFAASHGLDLTAVHVGHTRASAGSDDMASPVADPAALAGEGGRVLAESLAGWGEKYPDVSVTRRPVRGHPAGELVREAAGAQLLVVGSRGRGGFLGLLLGSVSRTLLHHAPCPVAVVRHHHQR